MDVKDIDVKYGDTLINHLYLKKHVEFIENIDSINLKFKMETCNFRMSAVYWCLMCAETMGLLWTEKNQMIIKFVKQCQNEDGGFSSDENIHIMVILDSVDLINPEKIYQYVLSLWSQKGYFRGDDFDDYMDNKNDFSALMIINMLKRECPHIEKVYNNVIECLNFDGSFGRRLDSESHCGQVYCCVGILSLMRRLDKIDTNKLGFWLCNRQLPSGGLNGRPQKKPDTCYSWWVLSSLKIIGKIDWIDQNHLKKFIYQCQDPENGGFSDRPGDMCDPFHTCFSLTGLSLMNMDDMKKVHPVYCLPMKCKPQSPEIVKIDHHSVTLNWSSTIDAINESEGNLTGDDRCIACLYCNIYSQWKEVY
ncbi:GGTase-II-beta, partial [Intoshia linei]